MLSEKTRTDTVRDMLIGRLTWSRAFLMALTEPMTDEQLVHRAGGKGNHAMWVMGHMASSEDFFRSTFSGTPRVFDESWRGLFGGGSEPRSSVRDYPSRATVLAAMRESRERLTTWLTGAEADLDAPLPKDLQMFAPDVGSALVSMVGHEMFHAGQVATCRASLGLARLMT